MFPSGDILNFTLRIDFNSGCAAIHIICKICRLYWEVSPRQKLHNFIKSLQKALIEHIKYDRVIPIGQ